MADIFSKSKRKEIMSKIRATNTCAEKIVYGYLRKEGVYFQKHYKGVEGTPDIALPRKKKAVFIDGDFWHGRYTEKVPQATFWRMKIASNIRRDQKVNAILVEKGWRYIRIWESDIKRKSSSAQALISIKEFLLNA